ncbi:MAG: cell division protein ZapA [Clostridiales bacterium]|nr:cell division protein ZapA [Clostridiales bacterium]
MKKHSNSNPDSLLRKYSDTSVMRKRKGQKEDLPLMTTYEQRFKGGSMSKDLTAEKIETLDEKIEKRNKLKEPTGQLMPRRVSVEIAGNRYLLGSNDDMSDLRIKRIASLANRILSNAKDNNPGLTNSKITTLALIDACDELLSFQDENSNLRTELMYLQQKVMLEEKQIVKDPTPMELLARENEEDEKKD